MYKPTRPEQADERIRALTQAKVPLFFMEAKGKERRQVADGTGSSVNRLRSIIPIRRLNFNARQLGKFDWRALTSSDLIPNNDITKQIIDTYRRRSSRVRFNYDDDTDGMNVHWVCQQIREELLAIHPDINFVVDVLVKQLFCVSKSKRKSVFWECFGDEVVNNLRKNIDQNTAMCATCGVRFYKESPRQMFCERCSKQRRRQWDAERKRKSREAVRILKKV